MVPTPWFNEAVTMLRDNPGLDVGVHLTLTSEWENCKWGPITHAPSLVDEQGHFFPMTSQRSDFPPGTGFLQANPSPAEVERELRAQIDLALGKIKNVTHLSCHMGTATSTPELRAIVEKLAVEYHLLLGARDAQSPGRFGGKDLSPQQKEQRLVDIVTNMKPGLWLIVEHPGLDTPEMQAIGHHGYENVAADRVGVTRAFSSSAVKEVIQRRHVQLISYGDLRAEAAAAAATGAREAHTTKVAPANAAHKKTLCVAVAQIPVTRDIRGNQQTINSAIDQAVAQHAQILLTPEGSLSGYTHQFDQVQVERALKQIVAKACSSKLALALGTCFVEPEDGKCYNEIRFYDAGGNFLGFHNKILRCGSLTKPPVGEINHYAARPLRTFQFQGFTIGGLICNDMWANPQCTPMPDSHLSQQLAERGVRIIFQAINGGRNGSDWSRHVYWPYHESNLRMRARAGHVWIVTADNCHPTNIPCSAPSGVLDPTGTWRVRAKDQGEQVVAYTIELE